MEHTNMNLPNRKRATAIALAFDSVSWLPSVGEMFCGKPVTADDVDTARAIRAEWNMQYCRNHGI